MTVEDLKALAERVSKNFEYLQDMVARGDTGARYERLFELWYLLLAQYEKEA